MKKPGSIVLAVFSLWGNALLACLGILQCAPAAPARWGDSVQALEGLDRSLWNENRLHSNLACGNGMDYLDRLRVGD